MDCSDYICQFWLLDVEFDFSGMETRLYFLLLDIAMHKRRFNNIQLNKTFLMIFVGCSLTQLKKGRRTLRNANLIDYYTFQNKCSVYSLIIRDDYERETYDPYAFINERCVVEQ